jgi:hypothetical protein
LLTPAVKAKLEEIAGQVTPCAAKKRRRQLGKRGEACGLADFVRRVGADQELRDSFARPLTDQVWHEVDSGYGSDDPSVDPGWEGDGDGVGHEDPSDGYFSNDDEGFYEGASDGEAAETVEAVVFSSEEEAAAIAASLSGADAAAAAAVWGGSTITAAGFLSWLWGNLKDKKPVPLLNEIPKESIHKITKTKTKTQTSTSSSSSSSSSGCPTQTDKPVSR